jgi:lipopolysaccharide exporter
MVPIMTNFIRNIFKLASANIIAQIVSVLLIPIVSRLYLPDDFGVLQQFTSLFSIIVIFSMGAYQLSIVLPEKDEEATSIFLLCLFLLSIVTILIFFVVFLFSSQISLFLFNEPKLSTYLYFLPLIILLNGFFSLLNYWHTRKKHFGVIASASITSTSSAKAVQIGSATLFTPSPLGLILGLITGSAAAVACMVVGIRKDFSKFRHKTKNDIKEIVIRYKKFPMYSVWGQLCNQVSIHIPTFLLSYFFSTTIVGYYSMANMVIHMPMTLIGSAISQVFLQRANEERILNGHSKKVVLEVHHLLLALGVLPIIVLMIIGSDIFSFFLGSNWTISGLYAAILGPWILLVFIASPISTLYNIYEKQKIGLAFNLVLLASRFLSIFIGGLLGGPILCLTLFSITGIIFWLWNNFYLIRLAGIPIRKEIHSMVRYILQGLLFGLPLLILRVFTGKIFILLPIACVLVLLYYGYLIITDNEMQHQLRSFRSGE